MENLNNSLNNNKPSTTDIKMRKLEIKEREKREFRNNLKKNKHRIIGTLLAIITVILLLNYGLFKTLGIWIILLIGYGIGAYYDRDINFLRFMNNFRNSLR